VSAGTPSHTLAITRIALSVPAEQSYLRTVRLVTADAAERAGFLADELDDARIAVDELCHALMCAAEGAISLSFRCTPHSLVVDGSAPMSDGPGPLELPPLAALVVGQLAADYLLTEVDHSVAFSLHLVGGRQA
jgi:hypothetical protein